jgi:hypothetical protein
MHPMRSLTRSTGRIVAALIAAIVGVTGLVTLVVPAGAASAPTIANGNAGYTPGTTTPPNQFNVITLVSGGASSVNTSSLTIVSQPASGTATAASGIISYTPDASTTGVQTLTFALCAPGDTYPSPGNCSTATMTYTPSTGQYLGDSVIGNSVIEDVQMGVTAPATAPQGGTLSASFAPVSETIPASDSGYTVNSAGQFSAILPLPSGLTYVPGTLSVTGGDATTSGHFQATYCTGPVSGACTAQINSGNYKTTYPYIETYLNGTVPGGSNVTLPTISAQFQATGNPGTTANFDLTEFVLVINTVITVNFDGYPSCASCGGSGTPTYQAPTPLASTQIVSSGPPAVSGLSPATGSTAGGTSVTISGTNLSGATAVDFGTTPATIVSDGATSITAKSPSTTTLGAVDVTVTTPAGTSATSSADQFTYTPPPAGPTVTGISPATGPTAGGTSVVITGTNLGGATGVYFGQAPAAITQNSNTQITATSPPGTGTADVTVVTANGVSAPSNVDRFSYGGPGTSQIGSWSDSASCGLPSTVTAPAGASSAIISATGGVGGGGGGAASSNSGGSGGNAGVVTGATVAVSGGQPLTAVTGCAGATAPHGSGVVSTGGAGGNGYTGGGSGGNGYYCAGVTISGACLGTSGPDGSGGGGGGSSGVCLGTSCTSQNVPLVVAGGGGGGGESMCAGSNGGAGGTGGGGSSTASADATGSGPSGTNGGNGVTSGNVGGAGGVNSSGGYGGSGGNGNTSVSLGDSAANGGGGGGYVGGLGSTANAAIDCGTGGGGGAGSSYAVNGSGASFSTSSGAAAVTITFYGFVGTPPSVTTQPHSQTVTAGTPVSFTSGASGNPSPAVQWQESTDGGATWTALGGANGDTYTFTPQAGDDGSQFRAVFTSSVGSATSNPATLSVQTPPVVTTDPTDTTAVTGHTATFTAAASGVPAPTVQWQVSTDGGATWNDVTGATSGTLAFTTAPGQSGNEYQAVFTNVVGSATSTAATLTLETTPTVTTQPQSAAVFPGASVTFTAAASGTPTPTVQWSVSTNGGATFTPIGGATSDSYTVSNAQLYESGYQYEATYTNDAGTATTDPATLTVQSLTITTTSLPNGSLYSKSNKVQYSATLTAAGGYPPYKWTLVPGSSLPPGLKLSAKGVIQGKAIAAGTFTFTVQVANKKPVTGVGIVNSTTKQLSVTVTG